MTSRKSSGRSSSRASKGRERTESGRGGKRYARRDEQGRFTEDQESVGRSHGQDVRRQAKSSTSKGQGDRGDRTTRSS